MIQPEIPSSTATSELDNTRMVVLDAPHIPCPVSLAVLPVHLFAIFALMLNAPPLASQYILIRLPKPICLGLSSLTILYSFALGQTNQYSSTYVYPSCALSSTLRFSAPAKNGSGWMRGVYKSFSPCIPISGSQMSGVAFYVGDAGEGEGLRVR